jgi:hypothetical protein
MVGLLAGAVVGAPLWGGFSTLFWSTAADTNDAQRAAGLLYTRTQLNRGWQAAGHVSLYRCGDDVRNLSKPGDLVLTNALFSYRRRLLQSKYNNLAVNSLTALPAPVLGALSGCVGGSPASDLCLSYVHGVVGKATTISPVAERAWVVDVDNQIESALCVADAA